MRSKQDIAADIIAEGPEFSRHMSRMCALLAELEESAGWLDRVKSSEQEAGEFNSNVHAEVSEWWEAWRENKLFEQCEKAKKYNLDLTCEAEEVADIMIRAMAYAGRRPVRGFLASARALKTGLDTLDVGFAIVVKSALINAKRGDRHGGKQA